MTMVNGAKKATEAEMIRLLRDRFCRDAGNGPSCVLLPQVRNAAGFDATRTADALVMDLWPSRGLHLHGFEVKCSRSDLLAELKKPEKAEAIAQYCERWWLVLANKDDIRDGELPEPWGLLVRSGKGLRQVKAAPVRNVPKELPKTFVASIMRQLDRELHRPTQEALRAEYERGIVTGKSSAGREVKNAEELRSKIQRFRDLTGIDICSYRNDIDQIGAAVNLLLGDGWKGLLPRLQRLSREAGELAENISVLTKPGTVEQ